MVDVVLIPGCSKSYARADFASALGRARAAGAPVSDADITSSFRDPTEQLEIFLSRYTPQATGGGPFNDVRWYAGVRYVRTSSKGPVGIPGRSLHEYGLAVDCSPRLRTWLLIRGAHYGTRLDPDLEDANGNQLEPWHYQYAPADDKSANDEEDDMFSDADRKLLNEVRDLVRPGVAGKNRDGALAALVRDSRNAGQAATAEVRDLAKAFGTFTSDVPLTGLSNDIIEAATGEPRTEDVQVRDAVSYAQAAAFGIQALLARGTAGGIDPTALKTLVAEAVADALTNTTITFNSKD